MTSLGKILAVDDDIRNLEILKHLLESNYQLVTATTGEEALQKVRSFVPDLVLLDIMMPGINGYDVCRLIKESEERLTKVILVSAKGMLDERLMGYEAGADDYIVKPFDHDEFLAKVKIFVRLKKVEDQLRSVNSTLEDTVLTRTKQLVEAEKQANKARMYVDNIIASMMDPLVVLSLDSKIQKVNLATTKLLNYSIEELVGSPITKIIANEGVFTGSDFETLIKNGYLENRFLNFVSKSGVEIPTLLSRSTIQDENGHISGIVCVAKDMTEQRKVEKEKEVMYRQLLQASKLASIGELATGIAHEINNPLTIIQGNVEIIQEIFTDLKKDAYQKYVNYQQDALNRITNIVSGLRTYARLDSVDLSTIDLHSILEQSVSIVRQIYKNENVTIETQLTCARPLVKGSSGRFQQVIMNLISNARDALVEQERSGTIRIWTGVEDENVVVKISDNGCGISDEQLSQIFEPFYTSKPAGKGTGLGLSIAQTIVQEMKGQMKVESVLEQGTTFILSFPAAEVDKSEAPDDIAAMEIQLSETQARFTGKVLVADDEKMILDLMTRYLEECGLEVEGVSNGKQAFEKLQTGKFELLITDLKMPIMRGEDLIKLLREDKGMAPMKIIAMTGNLNADHLDKAAEQIQNTVDKFIKKPFSKKEVYTLLKELL